MKDENKNEEQNNDQHNDQNDQNNDQGGSSNKPETHSDDKNKDKTFTQDELNSIVESRLAKERKKYPSEKELKAFNDWKASQKTEEEKAKEKDDEIASLKKQIADGERMNSIRKADVSEAFHKFVLSEVSSMDGDFDTNLQNYLKENPQYVKSSNRSTGMRMNGSNDGDEDDGVTAILKRKHPNIKF